MPHATPESIDVALKRGAPDRVYLFLGEDEFLKEEKVRAVIEFLVEPGIRDFNLDVLQGPDADAGRLSTALDALPLMAARRLVVVRDFPGLKKEPRAILDRYLGAPAEDTVLVLVAPASWKPDAPTMSHATTVEFAGLRDDDVLAWTKVRAEALGSTISSGAAQLLVTTAGTDLAAIDGELRKLRDYATTGEITEEAVRAVVGVTEGRTSADLIDAVCARDGVVAATLVPVVLSQPRASAIGIVMSLTTHLLGIGQVLVDRGNRVPRGQQAKHLYAMMGEARGASVGRPWGEAVSAMTAYADQWDGPAVDRALGLLAGADSALKNTGLSSDGQMLGTLVLAMCARNDRRPRAA